MDFSFSERTGYIQVSIIHSKGKEGCKSDTGDEEAVSGLRRTLGLYVRGGSQGLGDTSLQPQPWGD